TEAATLDNLLKPAAGVPAPPLWFARVDGAQTTVWAQFSGVDPNQELVEINMRQTVFYPDQPGRDFITVRGFTLRQAATPWAPPTAEQIGLIGTHWSKGWIIENNTISHSVCSGIALGKHGDEFDNTSADTAEGYVKTIERAHAFTIPWTRDRIGHHLVRNNTISHCEQTGIVGSLGAAFSTITGNTIHDIHVRRLFSGAEMAGIKLHAAIDTTISGNHIYRTCRGLWLDWMAQGTRVSGNLFHDNADQDLFMEVNHGPFVVDNNLFLSAVNLLDVSEGGTYAHNLFTGRFAVHPELNRETPYHPAHSTEVAGLAKTPGGDNRFYNNIFVGPGGGGDSDPKRAVPGLSAYDSSKVPQLTGGNIYCNGARSLANERNALVLPDYDPALKWTPQGNRVEFSLDMGPHLAAAVTARVTTQSLGQVRVPKLPYQNPDGTSLVIDTDFLGRSRDPARPSPGPFEHRGNDPLQLQLP
ncbi:MAG: right-handed parallel beta-helix repeat-containing protein, partial [Akkermansiaceae bacterium]|nr:right-handed parallel beta-helix repeat-containing protein [Akkermansiaceae bacterium]